MDRVIEQKGKGWKRILLWGGGGVILVLLLYAIYRDAGTSRLRVEGDRILLDTVRTGTFQEFIPITGTLLPIRTVFLDAVEGGRVEEILVEDGAELEKGQEILRLSNPDLLLSTLNQEANIVSQINQIRNTNLLMEQQSLGLKEQALAVEFTLDILAKRVARNQELYEGQVISKVEYEETRDEYEHLQRRRDLLKSTIQKDSLFQTLQNTQMSTSIGMMERNLEIARNNLNNLEIKAPLKGHLSSLNREIGELITEGERIAQIDDLSSFKVRGQINEFYVTRISPGQTGRFQQGGKSYMLEIKKIYPEVRNGTFEVDLVFTEDQPQNLKRGQSLSIRLELGGVSEALLLAKGSFFQETGGKWVYVLNPETGVAVKREIQIGQQNPDYYEIKDGLFAGEVVIISNYTHFGEQDELRLH